jgi:hypothetical protein
MDKLRLDNAGLQKEVDRLKAELGKVKAMVDKQSDALRRVRMLVSEDSLLEPDVCWRDHLEEYLDAFDGRLPGKDRDVYRANTRKSYKSWITPWIAFIEEKGRDPTPLLLKAYLNERYSNPDVFNRVGKQIVAFTNEYSNLRMHLIKKRSKYQPNKQHAKMDKGYYSTIKRHIEKTLKDPKAAKKLAAHDPSLYLRMLAVYFGLVTGARPNESAFVVQNKKLFLNDRCTNKRWKDEINYMATMDKLETKTSKHYTWLIPSKRDWFVDAVKKADTACMRTHASLHLSVGPTFHSLREEAGLAAEEGAFMGKYNMRSARCYQATKWVQNKADFKEMGWEDEPPNPLQHTTPRLAETTYAKAGAANRNDARHRCIEKYPEEAKKRFDKLGWNFPLAVGKRKNGRA